MRRKTSKLGWEVSKLGWEWEEKQVNRMSMRLLTSKLGWEWEEKQVN